MGSGSELSILKSVDDNNNNNELIELKSNNEDINKKLVEQELITGGTTTLTRGTTSYDKLSGLRKWRRIPRGTVIKKEQKTSKGNLVILSNAGDGGDFATREDSRSSEDRSSLNGGNLIVDNDDDDQERIGRVDPGKKARGFKMESNSEFVFVHGTNDNTVTSKGSGMSAEYDEELYSDDDDDGNYADDKHLNEEEAEVAFIKSDNDGSQEDKEDNNGKDDDVLVESIKRLNSAQEEFAREVQKWKDVGKDSTSIFDDSIPHILKRKDAKILELESALTSGGAKTEFDDHLKKGIQAEVEYIAISTKTERLTSELLPEIKQNLQQENVSSQELQKLPKKQAVKLVTREDVKKMQNRRSECAFLTFYAEVCEDGEKQKTTISRGAIKIDPRARAMPCSQQTRNSQTHDLR